jgi:CubicO group peptidase (beta-lactamase class C family)
MGEQQTTISKDGRDFVVSGSCDPEFAAVREAFETNYRVEEEVGSIASVVVDGKQVVDLWGGFSDKARTKQWQRDTILCMMSVTKGVAAITFNHLIDQGLVDLDAPIAKYWPEFGQAGKEKMPVRYALDHRAGLCIITEKLPRGSIFDWNAITGALARQAPLWEPGSKSGYHIHNQGFLLGEITRRVTGKTLAAYYMDEIARPLGLDYQIGGLSKADQARCAEAIPTEEGTLLASMKDAPKSMLAQAWNEWPDAPQFDVINSATWRECELSSANGHGTARAIARLYGTLARGGEMDGIRVLSKEGLERMTTEQHCLSEVMMGRSYHQALGLVLNTPSVVWMGPNPRAFGHQGIGGSIGMADRDAKLGFCFGVNKWHSRHDNGPRARRVLEAIYKCL